MREIWKEEIKNSEFEMEEREEENKSMKEREESKSMKEREENKSMKEQEDDKSMDVEQTCSVSFTIQHSLLFKHLPPALDLRRNT